MTTLAPQVGELWTDGQERDVWKIVSVEHHCHMVRIRRMSSVVKGIARWEEPFYTPLERFLADAKPIKQLRPA